MAIVKLPAAYAPQFAMAFGAVGGDAVPVDSATPLPVAVRASQSAATSAAVSGTMSASGQSAVFTPELGRPTWVGLFGSWSGSVTLERRVGPAGIWRAVTLGGASVSWTGNANEPAYEESVAGAQYRLSFARTSGTLDYEVQQ